MARSDLHQAAILGQQKISTPFILTSVANLESQINLTLHAFGLWDELDYLERTHAGRARTSKLHTGVLASDQELIQKTELACISSSSQVAGLRGCVYSSETSCTGERPVRQPLLTQ